MKRMKVLQGFTLVEIALVLVIVSLLLGAGFAGFGSIMDSNRHAETSKALDYTKQALLTYVNINNFLPCPDVDGDGVEDRDTTTTPHTCKAVEGKVPYKDIGLSISQVRDAWRNVFLYHLNERVTKAAEICDPGYSSSFFCNCKPDSVRDTLDNCKYGPPAFLNDTPPTAMAADSQNLTVKDAASGVVVASQISVVVLAQNSNAGAQCSTLAADEQENCDGDAIFVSHERTDDPFFDDQLITISGYEIRRPALTHEENQTEEVVSNLQSLFAQSLKAGIETVTLASNMDEAKKEATVNFLGALDKKLAEAETPLLDLELCATVPAAIADTDSGDVKVIDGDLNAHFKLDDWLGIQLLGHLLDKGQIKSDKKHDEKYVYVQKSAFGKIDLKSGLTEMVIAGIVPGEIKLDGKHAIEGQQVVRICGDALLPQADGETVSGCPGLQAPELPPTDGATQIGDKPSGWHLIKGTSRNDRVVAGNKWVEVYLYGGDDQLTIGNGGAGYGKILLGQGNDYLKAGDGWDYIDGSEGDDQVTIGSGSTKILLGQGNDRLKAADAGAGYAEIDMGQGDDSLEVGNGFDKINMGQGNDKLIAGNGSTQILLDQGDDCASLGDAGAGYAKIDAGQGNDRITAGDGFSEINLGEGDDYLAIGNSAQGWTKINAGQGDDVIVAGYGFTEINGGNGEDIVYFRGKSSDYTVEKKWGRNHVIHKATQRDTWLNSIESVRFTEDDGMPQGNDDDGGNKHEHGHKDHDEHHDKEANLFVLQDFKSKSVATDLLVRDQDALSVKKAEIKDGNGFVYLYADPVEDEDYSVLHDKIKMEGDVQTLAVVGPLGGVQQVKSHDKPKYHHWDWCQKVMEDQKGLMEGIAFGHEVKRSKHKSKQAKVEFKKAKVATLLVLGNCATELKFDKAKHNDHDWRDWFGGVSFPSPFGVAHGDDDDKNHGDKDHDDRDDDHGKKEKGHDHKKAKLPGAALFVLIDQIGSDTATRAGYPIGYGGNVYPSCKLNTFDADDLIVVRGSLFAEMDTADGDDVAYIHNIATEKVSMGSGNDVLVTEELDAVRVEMGVGDDLLTVSAIKNGGEIDMGSGNDTLEVAGMIDSDAQLNGGSGDDVLTLKAYDESQYQDIKDRIYRFESIMLSDGTVIKP
ncbi:prepilin-type N-terminal cleavage/methylation domain-containing protein [Sulfurivirga caldicuralii]|uniref:Prepilin-type N-terminal cleavage/methylation domain-containing protein n=1 Tax=Sulfurivirga caldicuralii TaxID=364032 RepID=A0A1N6DBA4_9GAMM|nr:calcium-binding protein [Sulfurivirga caldicuralii]SIN68050.1 prepilin-type N-terminal cleavage/methylation domain-containing protein [Sulfurivirga caldicuralii]